MITEMINQIQIFDCSRSSISLNIPLYKKHWPVEIPITNKHFNHSLPAKMTGSNLTKKYQHSRQE